MKLTLALSLALSPLSLLAQAVFGSPSYVASFTSAGSAAVANTLTNEIAAYWTMDEASGTRADSSGNSRTLSLLSGNAVGSDTGLIGSAASGMTSSSYALTRADEDWMSAHYNSLTFAGWVMLNATNTAHRVVTKYAGVNGQNEYNVYWDNSANAFGIFVVTNGAAGSLSVNATTNGVVIGAWNFVCAQIDATNKVCKIRYGNTSQLYGWNTSGTFNGFGPAGYGTNTTAVLHFGKMTTSSFNGRIDEFGIWPRLLTDSEVTSLYNSGSGRTWPLQ